VIGLPVSGVEGLKLAPGGGEKRALRVARPTSLPDTGPTASAAESRPTSCRRRRSCDGRPPAKPATRRDPSRGVVFDGRSPRNFKLRRNLVAVGAAGGGSWPRRSLGKTTRSSAATTRGTHAMMLLANPAAPSSQIRSALRGWNATRAAPSTPHRALHDPEASPPFSRIDCGEIHRHGLPQPARPARAPRPPPSEALTPSGAFRGRHSRLSGKALPRIARHEDAAVVLVRNEKPSAPALSVM